MMKLSVSSSPRSTGFVRRWPLPVAALLLALVFGCGKRSEITDYKVDKDRDDPIPARQGRNAETPKKTVRMLAAMIPQDEKSWFFKVEGPVDVVAGQEEKVKQLLGSVSFPTKSSPRWKLPEGWTQERSAGGMRFATIRIPTEPALEMSVMPLPTTDVLENVNRWRRQVSLPPISPDQLEDEMVEVPTADTVAMFFNLLGKKSAGGGMQAPFAGGQSQPPPRRRQPAAPELPSHDVPEGWEKIPSRTIELETFQVKGEGNNAAKVTTIRMGPLREELLLANINRWRGQVKLEPIAQNQVPGAFSPIKAGDRQGRYLKLEGAEEAMLIAILEEGGATWYFKMLGDAPLVMDQEAKFKNFVQSVRFSPDEEAGDE